MICADEKDLWYDVFINQSCFKWGVEEESSLLVISSYEGLLYEICRVLSPEEMPSKFFAMFDEVVIITTDPTNS